MFEKNRCGDDLFTHVCSDFFFSFKENNKIRSNFPMCFWYDSFYLKTCSIVYVLAWYVVNCEKWVVIDPFQEIRPKKILFLGGWECGCVRTRYWKISFLYSVCNLLYVYGMRNLSLALYFIYGYFTCAKCKWRHLRQLPLNVCSAVIWFV